MKIAINFRSFIYSMAMLIATIFACLLALNISWLGLILLLVLVFAPITTVFLLKKRPQKYKIITVGLSALLCFVAIIIFFITVYTWTPSQIEDNVYKVSGSVEDNFVIDDERVVVLRNVRLNGEEVSGKIKVYVIDDEKFFSLIPIGDKLEFSSYVSVRKIVDGYKVNANSLRTNVRYLTWINAENVNVYEGNQTVLDKINCYVKNTLIDCMGNQYGVIAYGMLTGDKNEISSTARDMFSLAGLAHILAVSGLHVGFLTSIVMFLLRKLKVKKELNLCINAAILFVYCVFAGFSPSIVRASIMFLIAGGATILGEQRDSLNSLGFAATCILTFSPFMMFEAGFVMSVGAVLGIVNFSPIISRGLSKIKIPDFLANAISISTSAQLGIIPASVCFFGSLQLYSIVVNVLLMPLMSVAFIAVFLALIISIIPIFKFFVTASGFLIKIIATAAGFCAGLPLAQIPIYATGGSLLIYPLYFLMGDFVGCKKKWILSTACATVIIALLVVLLVVG